MLDALLIIFIPAAIFCGVVIGLVKMQVLRLGDNWATFAGWLTIASFLGLAITGGIKIAQVILGV